MSEEEELQLIRFGEWLDQQGLLIVPDGDERTHEDLVRLYAVSGEFQ